MRILRTPPKAPRIRRHADVRQEHEPAESVRAPCLGTLRWQVLGGAQVRLTEAEYAGLLRRRNAPAAGEKSLPSAEREPAGRLAATEQRKPLTARFVLPWPPKGLSPNDRLHWAALSRLKREYRKACRLQVLAQGAQPMEGCLRVQLEFVPPDRRKRDWDNLVASMKAGLDGLADALQVDDAQFVLSFHVARDQIAGLVRVSVEPA